MHVKSFLGFPGTWTRSTLLTATVRRDVRPLLFRKVSSCESATVSVPMGASAERTLRASHTEVIALVMDCASVGLTLAQRPHSS